MDLKQKIDAMGFNKLELMNVSSEIKHLPQVLFENEVMEFFSPGRFSDMNGALVLTDKRAIFISKNLFKTTIEDFAYKNITSVQNQTGLIFGEIIVFCNGNRQIIKNIGKDRVAKAADIIRGKIS